MASTTKTVATGQVVWEILRNHGGPMFAWEVTEALGEFGKDWTYQTGAKYSVSQVLSRLVIHQYASKVPVTSEGAFLGYAYSARQGEGPSRKQRSHGHGELRAKVLQALATSGPLTCSGVAEALGLEAYDVKSTLSNLTGKGVLSTAAVKGSPEKVAYSYTPSEPETEQVGRKRFKRKEIGPAIKKLTARAKRDPMIFPGEYQWKP